MCISQLISTLCLPGSDLAYTVITAATPPEAVALPLGTLFLGTLLIQERRRRDAEAAVIESERRFHTITDNLPGVVYQRLLTVAGEISYPFFSARVEELFGVTAEAGDGRCLEDPEHHPCRRFRPPDIFDQGVGAAAFRLGP